MFNFSKAEVFTSLDNVKFALAAGALDKEGIEFTTKTVNIGSANRNSGSLGAYGERSNLSIQYYIYVNKRDLELAQHIVSISLAR